MAQIVGKYCMIAEKHADSYASEARVSAKRDVVFTILVPDVDRFWRGLDDTPQSHVVPQRHAHNLIVHRHDGSDYCQHAGNV